MPREPQSPKEVAVKLRAAQRHLLAALDALAYVADADLAVSTKHAETVTDAVVRLEVTQALFGHVAEELGRGDAQV